MAQLRWNQKPNEGEFYLLIDHSVGKRGTNLRDDTVLVQFMLNEVLRPGASMMQPGPNYGHVEPSNLSVDGVCGPKTIAEILKFQRACNARFSRRLVAEDATINSTVQPIWTNNFTLTTLGMLNSEFFLSLKYRAIDLRFAIMRLPIGSIVQEFLRS